MNPWLACRDVSKRFGSVEALRGVSIVAESPMLIGLVGPNGSGKTVLLDILSGFVRPDIGTVERHGVSTLGKPAWQLAREGVARTFSGAPHIRGIRVGEYLRICVAGTGARPRISAGDESEQLAKASQQVVSMLGSSVLEAFMTALSFGQRKIVMICGALARPGDLLLLDEPLAALDAANATLVVAELVKARVEGRVILWAEHDVSLLRSVCDQLLVLCSGVSKGQFVMDADALSEAVASTFGTDQC